MSAFIGLIASHDEKDWVVDPENVFCVTGLDLGENCLVGSFTLTTHEHRVEVRQAESMPQSVLTEIKLDGNVIHREITSKPTELVYRIHLLLKRHPVCKGILDKLMVPPEPDKETIARMKEATEILDKL